MVETRINMLLTEDETRKFEVIKEDIGLRTKSEVVRFCINYVFNDAVKLNQDKDNP